MKFNAENCGYCGACVGVCPNNVLELTEGRVLVNKGCNECGTCAVVCPLGALILEAE